MKKMVKCITWGMGLGLLMNEMVYPMKWIDVRMFIVYAGEL